MAHGRRDLGYARARRRTAWLWRYGVFLDPERRIPGYLDHQRRLLRPQILLTILGNMIYLYVGYMWGSASGAVTAIF
jgi:hypothetical protein